MLHEILLSLSGHPSPLLSKTSLNNNASNSDTAKFPLLSPPEVALLTTVSELTELHVKLRQQLSSISASHQSVICRAVASSISSRNLRDFQKKVLEVEKAVLAKDAAYVGAYGIVPLSTVVGEFAPWTRRLHWLWEVVCFMLPQGKQAKRHGSSCPGPDLMNFLRRECYTGYKDLEDMAHGLVETAEKVWLQQLSSWLLWGKLPSIGADDLFIHPNTEPDGEVNFVAREDLFPLFVSSTTADSILFIGKSLNQIRTRGGLASTSPFKESRDPLGSLLPTHLQLLETLKSPFSAAEFTQVISEIRISLSRNALAQLLPVEKVIETIDLLQRFLLMEQGEFAVSLIGQADRRMQDRNRSGVPQKPVRKVGLLDNLTVREGEVSGTLNQTWAELASWQHDDDPVDEQLERARDLVHLVIQDINEEQGQAQFEAAGTSFDDLLFPTRTCLSFSIEPPLDLFLSTDDIQKYSKMASYLLSLRRAELHLSSLWQVTSLRRCQPTPPGPSFSASNYGQNQLKERRAREMDRTLKLRRCWAVATVALFLVTELGAYLQGSVIHNYCHSFQRWLKSFQNPQSRAEASSNPTRPSTAEDPNSGENSTELADTLSRTGIDHTVRPLLDPSTLGSSHHIFLDSLMHSLFLNTTAVTQPLHQLLISVEHFVAVMNRLAGIYTNLDLEAEGVDVGDPMRSYAEEEVEVLSELKRTREEMMDLVVRCSEGLKGWEDIDIMTQPQRDDRHDRFQLWRKDPGGVSDGIEGLIMRLQFLHPQQATTDKDLDTDNEV